MLSVSHPKTGGFPRLNRRGLIEAIAERATELNAAGISAP